MIAFLSWYLVVTLLGWLVFPLAYRSFPALADRAYSLSRIAGLLLWGFLFWLMASLGIAQNDIGGLTLALTLLLIISLLAMRQSGNSPGQASLANGFSCLREWIGSNQRLILRVEILFFVAFSFLAVMRSAGPDITGTEKPMELAFINAILRSPRFPPSDPWLSGYAISYYYFGYVMTAMLAKLTAVRGSVAFNLMISLVFALSAVGAYGILYNLLMARHRPTEGGETDHSTRATATGLAFLGPLFLLLVSNFEGFLELLHSRGALWKFAGTAATSKFWTWLNIKDLNVPPPQPLDLNPDRFWWWWRASRVVQDFDLAGTWHEIIDEFPFFSFLLGDLHPHVLSLPFAILAVGVALHIYLGGWRTEDGVLGIHIRTEGFLLAAVVVGGMAFLNTWDILPAFVIVCGAYLLSCTRISGWGWARLAETLEFGFPLAVAMIVLYLPFYTGFSSQLGGVLPNLVSPTRGAHLWVMFGTLLLPLLAYLVSLWSREKIKPRWGLGFSLTIGVAALLWGSSWLLALLITRIDPSTAQEFLRAQGMSSLMELFNEASKRRLETIGGTLTGMLVLGSSLAFLLRSGGYRPIKKDEIQADDAAEAGSSNENSPRASLIPSAFTLLLIVIGSLLVLGPDFLYLRDQFGWRMNTIFKFYYQAWSLWSLAAAFGVAILSQDLRRGWATIYRIGLVIVLTMGLVYPVLGVLDKTQSFAIPEAIERHRACQEGQFGDCWRYGLGAWEDWTLDGAAYLNRINSDDAAAIAYLQQAPYGVVAETVGGSYSPVGAGRISTHSGLPTVLGWPGHESQWRGTGDGLAEREQDVRTLYETEEWTIADEIIQRYGIRYIVVGTLERDTYQVNETLFQEHLQEMFRAGGLVIYGKP